MTNMKVIDGGGEGKLISISRFRRERPKGIGYCAHRAVRVDSDDRVLECRDCGADVDPFDFISYLSRNWDHVEMAVRDCKQRADDAAKRAEEIAADTARVKARLAREREKAGEMSEQRAHRAAFEIAARMVEREAQYEDKAFAKRAREVAARIRSEGATAEWKPAPTVSVVGPRARREGQE